MIDISMNDCKPDPLDMSTDPQSCPIMHPTGFDIVIPTGVPMGLRPV
jgi:hypothetical protein